MYNTFQMTTPESNRKEDKISSPSAALESGVGVAMPVPSCHHERHSKYSQYLRDAIIGFSDGLTVPFALTAGLSAVGSIKVVIVGGLAELFAGAISMGVGAWLAAETERQHYYVEEEREKREVQEMPEAEEEEIYEIFDEYAIGREAAKGVVEALKANEDMWVKFMMDFELKFPKPGTEKCWISASVIGLSYFIGGLIPMIPYFIYHKVNDALFTSIGISVIILLLFGYTKGYVTGLKPRAAAYSAIQTLIIGALASGASYGIVRGVNQRLGD